MDIIRKTLPHVSIVLAGLLIVLIVLDYFNGSMGFLDNTAAKSFALLLCVSSIANAVVLIAQQRGTSPADR